MTRDTIWITQDGIARLRDAIETEWGEGDPYDGPNPGHDYATYVRARRAVASTPVGALRLSRDIDFTNVDETTLTSAEYVALLIEYFGLESYF